MSNILESVSKRVGFESFPLRALRVEIGGVDVTEASATRVVDAPPPTGSNLSFAKRSGFRSRDALDKEMAFVLPDGRKLATTKVFWQTFSQTFGLSRNTFDYIPYKTMFEAIAAKRKDDVRIGVEMYSEDGTKTVGRNNAHGKALSCVNPSKPLLRVSDVANLVSKYDGVNVTYADGVVGASFPSPFPSQFNIIGKSDSEFTTRSYMQFPVHGFGTPAAFLELLRQVCTNGAVAMSKAFRTTFSLGKDDISLGSILDRAMASFNNEEGYSALKQRFLAASKSWASLYNMCSLAKIINNAASRDNWDLNKRTKILSRLEEVTKSPLFIYGVASSNDVSSRMAKSLPIEATVYDLLNFATEVSTHHCISLHARNCVYGWVGDLISNEYDLENSCEVNPEFTDYFLNMKPVALPGNANVIGNTIDEQVSQA